MDRTHWTLDDYCDAIGATERPTRRCPTQVIRIVHRTFDDQSAECWRDFVIPYPYRVALDSPCNTFFYDVSDGDYTPIVQPFKTLRDALDEMIGD